MVLGGTIIAADSDSNSIANLLSQNPVAGASIPKGSSLFNGSTHIFHLNTSTFMPQHIKLVSGSITATVQGGISNPPFVPAQSADAPLAAYAWRDSDADVPHLRLFYPVNGSLVLFATDGGSTWFESARVALDS